MDLKRRWWLPNEERGRYKISTKKGIDSDIDQTYNSTIHRISLKVNVGHIIKTKEWRTMTRKSINTVVMMSIIFLLPLSGFTEQSSSIYTEPAGGFRYVIPKGWTIAEFPGLKFKIAHGSQADGFTPNINIADESFSGSIEDYANASLEQIKSIFQNFKYLGKSIFITNSGMKGVKLVTEATQMGNHLRQTFYFFDGKGGKKLVVSCSVLAKDGNKFAQLFDASIKTFEVK